MGITLRGGAVPEHPHLSRPLVITQVRPNGPAQRYEILCCADGVIVLFWYRSGLIRVGDRLLKVDHHSLVNKTLGEAQQLLTNPTNFSLTTLTVEYDVSIMESVKYANGPLLVEIDRQMGENLGLVLTNCCELGPDEILSAGYFIDHILPASTGDRCGALNPGDQILSIDDVNLENWNGSCSDAERLLRRATKLQILPFHAVQRASSRSFNPGFLRIFSCISKLICFLGASVTGFSTLNSRRSKNRTRLNRQSTFHKSVDSDSGKKSLSAFRRFLTHILVNNTWSQLVLFFQEVTIAAATATWVCAIQRLWP